MNGAESAPSLENRWRTRGTLKTIRIHEYGGGGTLKLEEVPRISITDTRCWFEFRMQFKPGRLEGQARLPAAVAPPAVREACSKMKSLLIRYCSRVECTLEEDR
jgi:hypothetical protein